MTTTDFKTFLDQIDTQDVEEMHDLRIAVTNEESCGDFTVSKNGDKIFVKSDSNDVTLMLSTEKAKDYFLIAMEKAFNNDLGIDGAYEFKKAMEKDD